MTGVVFGTGKSPEAQSRQSVFSSREDDWSRLEGAYVEIRQYHKAVRTGIVDTVAPDTTMLWIAQDGALPRQIFLRADGYETWCFHQ